MVCNVKQHLKRVIDLSSVSFEDTTASSSSTSVSTKHLSVPPEKCEITTVSAELLECTWKKAKKLLNTPGSICKAPGMCDTMCFASDTGDKPHVSKTKKGNSACDDACLAWKSRKLCSHVLAVAQEWNCLNDFLSCYRIMKVSGNYTAVCMHNQPKNVDQKPSCPNRKGPSQNKRPNIDSYVDPLLYYSS